MRKKVKNTKNKNKKNNLEERLTFMVTEYQEAKSVLDSMSEGTSEYANQKKICDKLFNSAEQYINKL
ncbi:hypothetical protein [Celerinatantimonas sp. MCCC 1A17872]|uniref:hypothetical protein n=1 Tax=Celerinatantimonas sp. MCCC 1A17872 TaxID=3177514 RepID=UPI0038C9B797